jgi:2-polyprenyl-3-methyl-5-hydroxy-6-metoxy-1,4-benzoquinol methylase
MAVCGACAGVQFTPFFRTHEWSVSGHYPQSPVQPGLPVAIELEACRSCGLIRQVPDRLVSLNYDQIVRGTARQLPDYAQRIITSLSEYGVAKDALVVEVGANDGTFLRELRNSGYHKLLGVEPSHQLAETTSNSGISILNNYFDRNLARQILASHGPAAAVICRHTLEHVPDIRELAAGISDLLAPGGVSFVEVPDTDWVITELFAHEIWDEHISYFRPRSLAALLDKVGLRPDRLERVRFRDTRNLLCWATQQQISTASRFSAEDEASPADVDNFQTRWNAFSARLRTNIEKLPRPLVAIGASHIQLNFLNFSGLDEHVDILVDDDDAKAGRFAPLARPVPIRTTADILATLRQGTLLLSAFPYPAWEEKLCNTLAPYGVAFIRPYDLVQEIE